MRGRSVAERRAARAEVDDPELVLNAALRFLEARPRSVAEVRRRLTTAGYRESLVDGAIERLTALGILDDAAFARAWVASRDRARPRGESGLRRELALKGVDRETIEAALRDRDDDDGAGDSGRDGDPGRDGDFERAERLLARRARSLEREADPRRRAQRAYALLARSGFAPDVAGEVSRAFARPEEE